jgi:hypothetical protein
MRWIYTIAFAISLSLAAAGWVGCTNPFAPRLDEKLSPVSSTLGDPRTVQGVFQNIQYAYTYRDTLIYGNLLHPEYRFEYYNSDRDADMRFLRDEEMRITNNLFKGADQIDLQWNDIVSQDGDSVLTNVTRNYNLKIVLPGNEVFRIDGRARLRLVRETPEQAWLIKIWYDASNS